MLRLKKSGRLAQLARASGLHPEGRGFESLSAHQRKKHFFKLMKLFYYFHSSLPSDSLSSNAIVQLVNNRSANRDTLTS